MRHDALARRTGPEAEPASVLPTAASAKTDYDALCAALSATARGRAFLDEHARRARRADTALALQALSRLEEQLRKRDTEGTARFHGELRALRSAVVSARSNFTRFEGMLAKHETVMALFDMLELRVTEMLAEAPAEPLAANENEVLAAAETQAALTVAETEATLAAVHAALGTVPLPDPAPSVRAAEVAHDPDPVQAIALEAPRVAESQAAPIVALERSRRTDAPEKETVAAPVPPQLSELESFPAEIFAPPPPPRPQPVAAPAPVPQQDIIALINALTQAEKIALFS